MFTGDLAVGHIERTVCGRSKRSLLERRPREERLCRTLVGEQGFDVLPER